MKYFRNDLWESINSLDLEESERAMEEWKTNAKIYWDQHNNLITRLDKTLVRFFNNNNFHDCKVNECKITQGEIRSSSPTSLNIVVEYEQEEWVFEYKKIINLSINFNKNSDDSHNGFEEWGYHELLPVDDNVLSHEILFSSGATILVHFFDKDITVKRR